MLRRSALEALQGVDLIVHAGDVGLRRVLEALEAIAPVAAVRGNVDWPDRVGELPLTRVVQAGEALLYILHDRQRLAIDPAAPLNAVISGHSHQPVIEWKNGVLYLNPGSAGQRRFSRPVSLAILEVAGKSLKPRLVELDPS
jgi:putative phosphoesterase